ncbi:hypothetical protein CTEN210_15796 [Chaetoceros tenuissimus]|uniref:SUI1 domain-containing protein n=1 Tax=Chaetoceros tenuissimus TaxID=426638 RepID=A0AAD3DAE7_9STRA|nr:hypothetical protein CTEN210_15796 [Chaetoceros tenuissimus]
MPMRFQFQILLLWIVTLKVSGFINVHVSSSKPKITQKLYAKRKFKINTNLTGDVSSDGKLADRKEEQEARKPVTTNLGVSKKKKMSSAKTTSKPLSKKAEKLAKERNGNIDSSLQAGISVPEDQDVQIKAINRGNKKVTVVRGLTSSMDDRKKLLKEIKSKVGGGGTLVDGVLELQGDHADKILQVLQKRNYSNAKIVK